MLDSDTKNKIENILSYITDEIEYEQTLTLLLENKEYDLSCIILWKIFLLFIYQRFSQIDTSTLCDCWDKKFNSSKPGKLAEKVNMENFYWPNEFKDDEIITFLGTLYPVDHNIVRIIQKLLSDRNRAAHVSSTKFTNSNFISFLDDMQGTMKLIESEHLKKFGTALNIDSKPVPVSQLPNLISELVSALKTANSFKAAENIEDKILNVVAGKLTTTDLHSILDAVLGNNQVYGAFGTERFLLFLYGYNKDYPVWDNFIKDISSKGVIFTQLDQNFLIDSLPF